MLDDLFHAICRIGVFIICAQAILNFRPREEYEKYLRLLLGIMILLQLILPFGKLVGNCDEKNDLDINFVYKEFEEEVLQYDAFASGQRAETYVEKMAIEEAGRMLMKNEKRQEIPEAEKSDNQRNDEPDNVAESEKTVLPKRESIEGNVRIMIEPVGNITMNGGTPSE